MQCRGDRAKVTVCRQAREVRGLAYLKLEDSRMDRHSHRGTYWE